MTNAGADTGGAAGPLHPLIHSGGGARLDKQKLVKSVKKSLQYRGLKLLLILFCYAQNFLRIFQAIVICSKF